jgi:hypothetical protein
MSEARRSGGRRAKKRHFCGNRFTHVRSASSVKLKKSPRKVPDVWSGYRIMDLDIMLSVLNDFLRCKLCGMSVSIRERHSGGLASSYDIICDTCGKVASWNSSRLIGQQHNILEINRRSVYAILNLGLGYEALVKFCVLMGLPPPVRHSTFDFIQAKIASTVKQVSAATEMLSELITMI